MELAFLFDSTRGILCCTKQHIWQKRSIGQSWCAQNASPTRHEIQNNQLAKLRIDQSCCARKVAFTPWSSTVHYNNSAKLSVDQSWCAQSTTNLTCSPPNPIQQTCKAKHRPIISCLLDRNTACPPWSTTLIRNRIIVCTFRIYIKLSLYYGSTFKADDVRPVVIFWNNNFACLVSNPQQLTCKAEYRPTMSIIQLETLPARQEALVHRIPGTLSFDRSWYFETLHWIHYRQYYKLAKLVIDQYVKFVRSNFDLSPWSTVLEYTTTKPAELSFSWCVPKLITRHVPVASIDRYGNMILALCCMKSSKMKIKCQC